MTNLLMSIAVKVQYVEDQSNPENIAEIARAGADTFVAGSAIFGKPDYEAVIDQMRKALASIK